MIEALAMQAGSDFMDIIYILNIVFFPFFIALAFFYPTIMLKQMLIKIEKSAKKIEEMDKAGKKKVLRKISDSPSKEVKDAVDRFSDFFVSVPSSIDPYGIVRKLDKTIRDMEGRFTAFVDEVVPKSKDKKYIDYGMRASISVHQISKIVNHILGLAKKYRNLQMAMVLQMQLPLIERIAEAEVKATEAFLEAQPIGDSVGPMVAAELIGDTKPTVKGDTAFARKKIGGKECIIVKAHGPEPNLGTGTMVDIVNGIIKKEKIATLITIDAAGKLEGEKTGSVSEGVGFVMRDSPHRYLMEEVAIPKTLSLEGIVVKMASEEASEPMRKSIRDAVPDALKAVERSVGRAKGRILIIGVGNTCGVGNTKKELDSADKKVEEIERKAKAEEAKKKKGKKWWDSF